MAHTTPTFAFDVLIFLSDKAAKELHSRHEPLVALVSYYASPAKHARRYADEVGAIQLSPGSVIVQLPLNETRAHISGKQVRRKLLRRINGPVKVNVNIVSGRRSTPDNLLSCDFIDGPLSVVQEAPVRLNCGLITEHRETSVKP